MAFKRFREVNLYAMRIFLSYAWEDREQAKLIYLALRDQGHKVFFDRADLPAGDEYHNRIREAIQKSHLFIFLLSPKAVDADSYTLTELAIAEKAGLKLFPAVLGETDIDRVPESIKAVTFYRSDGNLTAGVAAEVHRIAGDFTRKRMKLCAAALTVIAIVCAGLFYANDARKKGGLIGKDGAPAVLVSAGSFVMGDDENSPRREIYVDAFYMDKHEVTVSRYEKFLQATGNVRPPEEWDTVDLRNGAELPVVGVDWHDADSYCRWAGKRLPNEAEWEKAARGSDERKYPWGNDAPTPEHARFGKPYKNPAYKDGVTEVGRHSKGMSPFGIHDLSGNVGEWVADWYSESFSRAEARNPKGPEKGTAKVMRGGGWYDPPHRLVTTRRVYSSPDQRDDSVGFRCASDVK
ncbi:MAG: SUMF1/EgtB/PvdO family nonheme iron enzyme [Candidatus Binatia bacterium]